MKYFIIEIRKQEIREEEGLTEFLLETKVADS
jgi:hypothetical protein